jgi:Protein of unknown function (DUF3617)
MNKSRVWTIVGCCGVALTALAWSQSQRKAGLWEVTTQMNMAGMPQMPQLPPGTQLPPGVTMPASPFAPHTTQVCVTQAMIDKYGMTPDQPAPSATTTVTFGTGVLGILAAYAMANESRSSNPHGTQCHVTNIQPSASGMTATMVCTGQMSATGTVQSMFVDADTAKTNVHITGTMQSGQNSRPIDMTMQSTSTYKGADCGSVQPLAMPQSQ